MGLSTLIGLFIRHGLTVAAGAAVAKGHIDGETATQLVGAGMAFAGVGLSVLQKRSAVLRDLG